MKIKYAKTLLIAAILAHLSSFSFAVTKTWNSSASSPWNWSTAANWTPTGEPVSGDTVYIKTGPATNPVIENSGEACYALYIGNQSDTNSTLDITGGSLSCGYKLTIGQSGNGILNISGGTTTITSTSSIGYSNGYKGFLNVTGGTLNIDGSLHVGGSGYGTLTITGGLVDGTGKTLYLPYDNTTGQGHINLYGGSMIFNSLVMATDGNGTIDVTEGRLILTNQSGTLDPNYVTAYGGKGILIQDYNETTDDLEVYAINMQVMANKNYIETSTMDPNLQLRYKQPVPDYNEDHLIVFDQDWEGEGYNTTIFQDANKYCMYYGGDSDYVCYADSNDGKKWFKQNLGKVSYAGNTNNNIIFDGSVGGTGFRAFMPFKDANHSSCDGQARYKAIVTRIENNVAKFYAYRSADRVTWAAISGCPLTGLTGDADSQQAVAFWDKNVNKYVCFYTDIDNGYRKIKRAHSNDFLTWSSASFVTIKDIDGTVLPYDNFRALNIMPMPDTPSTYIGLPHRFIENREKAGGNRSASSTLAMISHDYGVNWTRLREAYIRPGPNPNRWTTPLANNAVGWGICSTTPDIEGVPSEWSLYINEDVGDGNSCLRRHTIRPQGFICVYAPLINDIEFCTKPFTLTKRWLGMNYACTPAGYIKFQLEKAPNWDVVDIPLSGTDNQGNPITGTGTASSIQYKDYVSRLVNTWKITNANGSFIIPNQFPDSIIGSTVRVRVKMKSAELYGISIE